MISESQSGASKAGGLASKSPQDKMQKFAEGPAVFHFRPVSYPVVTGDRIREWERIMREKVGLNPSSFEGDEHTTKSFTSPSDESPIFTDTDWD